MIDNLDPQFIYPMYRQKCLMEVADLLLAVYYVSSDSR